MSMLTTLAGLWQHLCDAHPRHRRLELDASEDFLGDYPDGDTADSFLLSYPSAWRVVLFDETYSGGCLDAGVCLYL